MKINYIITVKGDLGFPQEDTVKSIEANLKPGDKLDFVCFGTKTEEEVLNDHISSLKEGDFTHICIINDGSLLRDFAKDVFETYVDDEQTVYMPIVELCNDINATKVTFKGFLNASIWKPYFAEEIGLLDQTLCVRGVDLILYGALIPTSVVKAYKFKPEIKYYSFFEYLSRIVYSKIPVLGIPKVTLRCVKDYELKDLPKEEKLAAFKLAQASYASATS